MFGRIEASLGPVWGQSGPVWGQSGPVWRQSGTSLGPVRASLGLVWGQSGPVWEPGGQSGASLGAVRAIRAPREAQTCECDQTRARGAQERPGTSQEQLRSDRRRFRAKPVFGRGQGFPTSVRQSHALHPPPILGSGGLGKKKEKIHVYILLRESSCRRLLAAAADPLVLVTLLRDGGNLVRGGRGGVRERAQQEPEAARGTRAQQKREVARRSPGGAQDEPRRSQKSHGSPGGA